MEERAKKKAYTEGTKRVHLRYVGMFCTVLQKDPDTLLADIRDSGNTEAQKALIQAIVERLGAHMKSNLHFKATTIHDGLSSLYSFLNMNGVHVTREDIRIINERAGKGAGILKFRKPYEVKNTPENAKKEDKKKPDKRKKPPMGDF